MASRRPARSPGPVRTTAEGDRAAHVARCMRVHELLRGAGCTVYELARTLEVSVKTARRDLQTLEAVGHGLECVGLRDQAKIWRLADRARGLHRVGFDTMEAMAVYIALVRCRSIAATGLVDGLEGAIRTMEDTLDRGQVETVRHLASKFYDRGEDAIAYTDKDRDNADAIVRALQFDERVTLTTRTLAGLVKTHYVEPLTIGFYQNGVYVAARYVGKKQVYRFALDNIEDVSVHRGDRFAYPEEWMPSAWFGRGFGIVAPSAKEKLIRVRIRFTGDDAFLRRIRRRILPVEGGWEPSTDSQSAVMWMTVGEADFEVPNWIVRFAGSVEVLEPAALREEVARRGRLLHVHNIDSRP